MKHPVVSRLPNAITAGRMMLVFPLAIALYCGGAASLPPGLASVRNADPGWAAVAGVLLLIAAMSDWIDGWLARRCQTQSQFGRLLDPIADKLVSGVSFVVLTVLSGMQLEIVLPVSIIIARDILVTARRMSGTGRSILTPGRAARIKTGGQMVVLILAPVLGLVTVEAVFGYLWLGGVWIVAVFSLWTGIAYVLRR